MSNTLTDSFIVNKRKSDTPAAPPAAKRARTSAVAKKADASAKALVATILAAPDAFALPADDDAVRAALVALATYAKGLEGRAATGGAQAAPAKTPEQIEAAAERVRAAAVSGIRKQMTWKPSCKMGTAKWAYDGICPDPLVFAVVLGFDGPLKFKAKKFAIADFEELMGSLDVAVRYDTLCLTGSDVNVRWNAVTGEFKFSGSYGRSR